MKFLKESSGQATFETLIGLTALLLVSFVGILVLLQGVGTLIATKWSAENSVCVAQQKTCAECQIRTRRNLQNYFSFQNIRTSCRVTRGIIHSEITALIAGHAFINGSYDLGASEYKRVSQ